MINSLTTKERKGHQINSLLWTYFQIGLSLKEMKCKLIILETVRWATCKYHVRIIRDNIKTVSARVIVISHLRLSSNQRWVWIQKKVKCNILEGKVVLSNHKLHHQWLITQRRSKLIIMEIIQLDNWAVVYRLEEVSMDNLTQKILGKVNNKMLIKLKETRWQIQITTW